MIHETAAPPASTLVLFSDGTGNSSAKLFKTNVWRMYEAVDLGPDARKGPLQIAYYDNGVGTQAIRVLAIIAGIFGFGLKASVLRLYRFACRNGAAGCNIYCFGFSRGAYTIRLVAALIAAESLVEYDSEDELNARSLDAFRRFMRSNDPNVFSFLGTPARAVRDLLVRTRRRVFGPRIDPNESRSRQATVAFIGVWDTVGAYGGPFAEITRGIDDYIYPLTMTDFRLDERVRCARHALALDDERDAFQPVLWDELDWRRKAETAHPDDAEAKAVYCARLKQVWFAGMHSDVGGGYPDESLSYVSLCWMMAEATNAGLRLLPAAKRRVRTLANSLGPIHDSRGGFGAYYRPQPRKIAAYLHHLSGDNLEDMTLALRDPVIGELQVPPHGQLLDCRIHESVIARLAHGTDDYAPNTLPPKIVVEPYSAGFVGNTQVDPAVTAHLQQRDHGWWLRQEEIWNKVWLRRVVYFLTVAATLAWVSLPAWVDFVPEPDHTDSRWLMERLTGWSRFVAPDFARPWVRTFEINPALFWGLIAGALALTSIGAVLKRKAWTASRVLWELRLQQRSFAQTGLAGFAKWRTGRPYQRTLQILKWRVAPPLAAFVLFVGTLWLLAIAGTQLAWSAAENNLCVRAEDAKLPPPATVGAQRAFYFTSYATCVAPRLRLERERRYEIAFVERRPWRDATIAGSPLGIGAFALGPIGVIAAPLRRIIDANYLQPLYEIRPQDSDRHPKVVLRRLDLVQDDLDPKRYSAIVTPRESGELFLFANDAALFGWRNWLYENNCGTALVTVRDLDAPAPLSGEPAAQLVEPPLPERCPASN